MTTAPQDQQGVSKAKAEDSTPQRFLNRELSWLKFNERVLAQTQREDFPLLERTRFLSIFSSNLDEFVMKRVGGLTSQLGAGVSAQSPDGMTPAEQLDAIRDEIIRQTEEQSRIYLQEIVPQLADEGIELVSYEETSAEERAHLDRWFRESVFPILTPLAVDPGHRFPFISSLSISIGVILRHPDQAEELFARVKAPTSIPQWVPTTTPAHGGAGRFVRSTEVIIHNLDGLFPDMVITDVAPFRVTRNIELDRDDADIDDLLESMEAELRMRRFASAVRLEVQKGASPRIVQLVLEELGLEESSVYECDGLLDYTTLNEIASLERPELQFKPWTGVVPPRLADEDSDIFATIRQGDIIVHHPYESFSASVERLIATAASDPRVLAIKMTLYRTSPGSPFVHELIRAAEAGKQVACLVELRARLDEFTNIQVAQRLEKAGVHVAYGVVGLKTHCKTVLVVRQDPDGLRCYCHLGTGNYNSGTARLYTDIGLLTCDPAISEDVVDLSNYLTGRSRKRNYNRLLVAPARMRSSFVALIHEEIEVARDGGKGRIIAKMNSLQDPEIIDILYEASQAGVEIDLIVRGFCCIRPGVPGLSENIRVTSVIGRFLEHSRIFYFGAGAEDPVDGKWFIASADWMFRNLSHRVEAATPINDRGIRGRLWTILETALADRVCSWAMMPDGDYVRKQLPADTPETSAAAMGSFEFLMRDRLNAQAASTEP